MTCRLLKALLLGAAVLAPATVLAQNALPPVSTQKSAIFAGIQTITQLIAGIAGKSIYITNITNHPASTSVFTLSYGTGTNCGTGTQAFYGPSTFQAGENVYDGDGAGAVFVVPAGNAVCVTAATATSIGWVSYAQF